MTDLTEFLLACFAEDEEQARESFGDDTSPGTWTAWVLAECEAKRRIVEEHPARYPYSPTPECERCEHFGESVDWPCPTLRLLALPYADHEGFRDEWRP